MSAIILLFCILIALVITRKLNRFWEN